MVHTHTLGVFRKACLLASLGATLYLPARSQTITAPTATYVFDANSGNIRSLIGRVGSAFPGDPVLTGLVNASIAPNGISAIAVWSDRVEWVADLNNYSGTRSILSAAIANPERFYWGRTSSTVALYASANASLQFLTLTAGAPAVATVADLSALPAAPAILAVDADRSLAAVTCAIHRGKSGDAELFVLQPGLSPRAVRTPESTAAASFAETGALYLAGVHAGVSLLADPITETRASLLFRSTEFSTAPSAILARSAAGLIYLADAAGQAVRVYDRQSYLKLAELPLDWQPTRFEPYYSNSFLLNHPATPSEPLLLLETAPQNSVVFIPAGE